jgi:hypothetical protein
MQRLDDYRKFKISLPLVNLATCYIMTGRYAEAEEVLLKGLAERVEEFGEDDQESFMYVLPKLRQRKLTKLAPAGSTTA